MGQSAESACVNDALVFECVYVCTCVCLCMYSMWVCTVCVHIYVCAVHCTVCVAVTAGVHSLSLYKSLPRICEEDLTSV